ncbi:MAG: tRNA preQ1(34) S-adenosylmethionine ribosyltransferase-isomerase QueA [bacterium]
MEKKYDIHTYNYDLPEALIAQTPLEKRDASRLLILDKDTGTIRHKHFFDILDYLEAGDCLVMNDTRVIPARIYGYKEKTEAKIEILILEKIDAYLWEVMMKNSKRIKQDECIIFPEGITFTVKEKTGKTVLGTFNCEETELIKRLWKCGVMPLPPYIKEDVKGIKHKTRYQTVFAEKEGAKAAPTAGLHMTPDLLAKLSKKSIKTALITLHVGLGTFEPVMETDIREHKIHAERFEITKTAADTINSAKRVIALGTTSLRALETAADEKGKIKPGAGLTSIYIYPGYKFKCVNRLITNFHLPESSLLFLVSAFAGTHNILNAYKEAVKEKYRFFSYGDAMFIK